MHERREQVASRPQIEFDQARPAGGAKIGAVNAAPITRGERVRRRFITVGLLLGSLVLGGMLSAIPRPEREIPRVVTLQGRGGHTARPMQLTETGYGFPFRIWLKQAGEVRHNSPTYVNIQAKPQGVLFNVLTAGLGLVALTSMRRRRKASRLLR